LNYAINCINEFAQTISAKIDISLKADYIKEDKDAKANNDFLLLVLGPVRTTSLNLT